MGGRQSKNNLRQTIPEVRPKSGPEPEQNPASKPKPEPLTSKPWREPSNWTEELAKKIKEDIQKLDPMKNPKIKPNLLLLGPIGAGKSSFINSVLSIGKGRKCELAVSGGSGKSWTLDVTRYADSNLLKQYYLLDSMGVGNEAQKGFNELDIVHLVKGHIKKGYTFNPANSIKDDDTYYRSQPKFRHQAHCVIFVVEAKTALNNEIDPGTKEKIWTLQEQLRREHCSRILILTKVDLICEEVAKDIRNLFYSVKIRDAVKHASELFHIGKASIHPVKNYEEDYNINTSTNIPLLLALKQAMEYADDRVEHVLNDIETDESD